MWSLDSRWFDVALIMAIFAVGNILFGHFEEHRPKWRRLLKVVIFLGIYVGIASTLGRAWALGLLGILFLGVLFIHAWWLPKHGVNGWTGEPRDRYYELVGRKRDAKARGGDSADSGQER